MIPSGNMRFKAPLDGLFLSQTSTRVLRVLVRSPEKSFTSRQLAGAADAPAHRVLEVLARLELEGIVSSQVVGRAYLWSTNREHPLMKGLEALFKGEERAVAQHVLLVGKHLRGAPGIRRLVVFGSAARGEERPESDLDLLVVVADARARRAVEERLTRLQAEGHEKFGSRIRPIVFTLGEYRRNRRSALVRAIEREGEAISMQGARA